MSIQINWYDNAAFRVDTGNGILWFDPSINKNADSPIKVDDVNETANFVFTTHGDAGHFTNSVQMTQKTGAIFVGSEDLCDHILKHGQLSKDRMISMKFGETRTIDGLEVYLFEAEHPELASSPKHDEMRRKWGRLETRNGGFVVRGRHFSLCLLGDCVYSGIFQDVGRRFQIDIGMIPIQSRNKTAPLEEAVESGAMIARDLKVKILFPVIQYSAEKGLIEPLERKLKEMGLSTRLVFNRPGMAHTLRNE